MKKLKLYFKRIYRLSLSLKKQEDILWAELKKCFSIGRWKYGVYENEKYIESVWDMSNEKTALAGCMNKPVSFFNMIYEGQFHSRVKILSEFPVEMTTDLFILATHFNNLLSNGFVSIDANNNCVECHQKQDLLIPLLYSDEIYKQISNHYLISKDIYSAFEKLIEHKEPPAIIIADFLKELKEKEKQNKEVE